MWFKNCRLNNAIKILGIHVSYNNETNIERNFLMTVKEYRMLLMYGIQEHLL